LGNDLECPGQPEHHLDGRGPKALLKPGNVAVLQTAQRRQVHLRPTFLRTPPDENVRECQAELPEIFQAAQCKDSWPRVALTIGKANDPLSLTLQGPDEQIVT